MSSSNGKVKYISIKNEVFDSKWTLVKQAEPSTVAVATNQSLLDELRHNPGIVEKVFGKVSSFNFSKEVFIKSKWDEMSRKARGLFFNNETGEILARGYDKFFNFDEGSFNTLFSLKKDLEFPVTSYVKYNGFLGLLTVLDGELLFCTKSAVGKDFNMLFENIFNKDSHNAEELKKYIEDNKVNLVFEVIDPVNDPHIVEYPEKKLVLLDIIKRDIDFKKASYEELQEAGKKFNFFVKEKSQTFDDYTALKDFLLKKQDEEDVNKEGFVFEGANGYQFKLKNKWYKSWKLLRSLKDKIGRRHNFSTSSLLSPEMNYFIAWCKKQDGERLISTDIITLRNEFKKEI